MQILFYLVLTLLLREDISQISQAAIVVKIKQEERNIGTLAAFKTMIHKRM